MADLMAKQTGNPVDPMRLRFGTGMMLMAAYASSVGGIGTPVGTPPNLIGIALIDTLVGVKIPFFQWMLLALPLCGIMFLVLFGLLYTWLHPPDMRHIAGSAAYVRQELAQLGPVDSRTAKRLRRLHGRSGAVGPSRRPCPRVWRQFPSGAGIQCQNA